MDQVPPGIAIDAEAGRDNHFTFNNYADPAAFAAAMMNKFQGIFGAAAWASAQADADGVLPHERHLFDQLDLLLEGAKDRDPTSNLQLLGSFLESLPTGASGLLRLRAKGNIGLQHLTRGDGQDAVRWLIEACDAAPDDPRAIANRALALWIGGDAEAAYHFGRQQLDADPSNETLALYLPQFAVTISTVKDGLEGIPEALRETKSVALGQAIFLRGRNICPAWWEWVRRSYERFPESDHLNVLAALSRIDEVTRDEEAQRTQIYTHEQREHLIEAAAILDADWQARPWLLKNNFDDAPHTLAGAMIAHQLLHDRDAAIGRAKRVADEKITYPYILLNAVMVALTYGQEELAKNLISLAPDDPDLAFHAGVIAVEEGDWRKGSELFARANLPESERRVAETVIALTPIREAGRPTDGSEADPAPLEELVQQTKDSPRGLIMIARVASDLGLNELAEQALEASVEAVPDDAHLATRLMIAAYAERAGSSTTLIQALDGHLPFEGFEREHQQLAIAHANEHPHRERNLAYFAGLPKFLRKNRNISRANASLLLDIGKISEAIALLRQLHQDNTSDSFITLRLIDALRQVPDLAGASEILRQIDFPGATGAPEHVMTLAHLVMMEGYPEKAYPVAYDLVRQNYDNSHVVLGYATLGLVLNTHNPMLLTEVAGPGASVSIKSSDGITQSFVIDDGGDFFGIRVHSPSSSMAKLVSGLRRGGTFELNKMGVGQETWTITEVMSKYLYLQRRTLEEFETRFPDKPGIARFTAGEDNIDTVLDVVRKSSEQNTKNARLYFDQPIPLGMVARGLGGDVVSFAQFIRQLGGNIATCSGVSQERSDTIELARQQRGKGAVVDPYTAWVASEIGILSTLKKWFGTLQTPISTVTMIDRMIERESLGRGQKQMTLSWHDGKYYRDEITDDHIDRQIRALTAIKEQITVECDIVSVLIPNEIPPIAEMILNVGGSHFLDAAFLAVNTKTVLISDDMHYRHAMSSFIGGHNAWMQPVLIAAAEDGELSDLEYGKAIAGLAKHGHDHLALSGPVLATIARHDSDGYPDLSACLNFIGGPKAEFVSHSLVFAHFLARLWPSESSRLLNGVHQATFVSRRSFLSRRKSEWNYFLSGVINRNDKEKPLAEFVLSWLQGRFNAPEVTPSSSQREIPAKTSRRRRRRERGRERG